MNKYALILLVIKVPHTKMGQETVYLATLTPLHSTRIPKLLPNQSKGNAIINIVVLIDSHNTSSLV